MASFARRSLLNITGFVAATSFLEALRPARSAQAAEGKPAWNVKGGWLFGCTCEAICPCIVGSDPTVAPCLAVTGYHIDSGRQGELALDGLNVARMIVQPGNAAKGNYRIAFYIDERATPAQREALSAIFSYGPGGAFASQGKAVAETLGVKFAPITFEVTGQQRKMAIAGIGATDVTALAGRDGKEVLVENLSWWPVPLVAGRSTRTNFKDYDVQWDVGGKNGCYSPFAFSST